MVIGLLAVLAKLYLVDGSGSLPIIPLHHPLFVSDVKEHGLLEERMLRRCDDGI